MNRLRPAVALLAAVLAGVSLAACGGKGHRTGATESTSSHAPAASGVKLTKDNFFDTVLAAMVKADSTRVTMSSDAGGVKTKASGALRFADPLSMTLSMHTTAGRIDLVFVNGVFYLRAAQMPGHQYVVVDTKGHDEISRLYARMPDLMNPAFQAKTYAKAILSLAQTGQAITIDGVKAIPYVVNMDTAKLGDLADLGLPGVASEIPKTLTLTWWIGPDDLLRRAVVTVRGATVKLTYSHWGTKVSIAKPQDVADETLQEMMNQPA